MQRKIAIPRELLIDEELMLPGMTSCQGCAAPISMKIALKALGNRTVIVFPACCFCVFQGGYPYTNLKVPVIHCPFETSAVVASGAAAALDVRGEKDTTVMVWAGDGGTFDIGIQALSGAAERNDNILFVCYDNEAYMNTGIQRSSATPMGAWTTTTPAGSLKSEPKKDIEQIMLAHHIAYMATASPAYPDDLYRKFQKARQITGMRFIHLLSACPPGWRIDPADSVRIMRLATQSRVFPIYEVTKLTGAVPGEDTWEYDITVIPEKEVPVSDYLKSQGRFRLMTDDMVMKIQKQADRKWCDLVEKRDVTRLSCV
jgi:pyruvate ferredoxin oxidoreductase beta subunit/2-oxoisovalerate ferredoxin oxidoreductase beta subunit